jgi:hypothetical protein
MVIDDKSSKPAYFAVDFEFLLMTYAESQVQKEDPT